LEVKQNENEFLEILSIVWDKKKLISLLVLFFSCVGFVYAFYISTPLYSSSVTFYLNSNNESNNSQLLNFASQFGV
jgi:capsular polysaccharide biosynthesis protein